MRFIAWNCCERFDRNYLHLSELDFDVAVVTESGPFDAGLPEGREATSIMKLAIDQPGHTKHIAVLARAPWRVEPLPLLPEQPWLLPVQVSGPMEFTVLAFWALGPGWVEGRVSYASQATRVITEVLPRVAGPVVFAGDFNAPIASSPTESRRHAANVHALAALGLVNAFSACRGAVDPLTEPTLYHQWKLTQPFHIDHVFLPHQWATDATVTIGSFDEWVGTRRSDHVPVVVDAPLDRVASGAALAP